MLNIKALFEAIFSTFQQSNPQMIGFVFALLLLVILFDRYVNRKFDKDNRAYLFFKIIFGLILLFLVISIVTSIKVSKF